MHAGKRGHGIERFPDGSENVCLPFTLTGSRQRLGLIIDIRVIMKVMGGTGRYKENHRYG
jgi:hypothetical protein